jgi:signal transduction histidine kinase
VSAPPARIAENIPDAIARLDRDLRYLYANRSVEQVSGLKADEVIGRLRGELGLPAAIEAVLALVSDVAARAREDEERLALLSHELRSPLNAIKTWAQVLENQLRDADPSVRRALGGIAIGVEQQVRLIDDLLNIKPLR